MTTPEDILTELDRIRMEWGEGVEYRRLATAYLRGIVDEMGRVTNQRLEDRLIRWVEENEGARRTQQSIADDLCCSRENVTRSIAKLIDQGRVVRIGAHAMRHFINRGEEACSNKSQHSTGQRSA